MKKIVNWIERFGLQGYISFEDNELRITEFDIKDKSDGKRSRPSSL